MLPSPSAEPIAARMKPEEVNRSAVVLGVLGALVFGCMVISLSHCMIISLYAYSKIVIIYLTHAKILVSCIIGSEFHRCQ